MMTFGDFVSACRVPMDDIVETIRKTGILSNLGPFSKSHLFYFESDEKAKDTFTSIKEELVPWMKPTLKLPFHDISIIEQSGAPIWFDRPRNEDIGWLCDRVIDLGQYSVPSLGETAQAILWIRTGTVEGVMSPPHGDLYFYFGPEQDAVTKDWAIRGTTPNPTTALWRVTDALAVKNISPVYQELCRKENLTNLANICFEIALISHPANYIVKVTPTLTPQEEKRARKFGKPPSYKRPHFIVLDHDVLISMRRPAQGTHGSPTPHHRRGHWARLADHCRHAKMLGQEKVWRRPTFVGDRAFSDTINNYEVLLDLTQTG